MSWPPTADEIRAAIKSDLARRSDPPEYDPDDAEAQRIAETCADANTEHDRIENEDRP